METIQRKNNRQWFKNGCIGHREIPFPIVGIQKNTKDPFKRPMASVDLPNRSRPGARNRKLSTQKLTSSVFAIRKCVAMVSSLVFSFLKTLKKQFTQKLANETKIKIAVLFLVLGPGWSFQNATPISGSRRPLEKCGRSAGRKRTDRAGGNRARERGRRAKKPNSRDTTMTRTQRRGARVCVSWQQRCQAEKFV